MRGDLSGDPGFRELLHRVRRTAIEAFTHQETPFDRLVSVVEHTRDSSRTPIFQVMFALQNVPSPALQAPGLLFTRHRAPSRTSKFDLTLFATEGPEGLRLTMEYSTDLFDPARVDRMLGHYRALLEEIVADPDQPIGRPAHADRSGAKRNSRRRWQNTACDEICCARGSGRSQVKVCGDGRAEQQRGGAARSRKVSTRRRSPRRRLPRGPVEEVVATVWETVLGLDHVGADESFFDIGGHSLLAAQVIARLREAFGVDVPLRTLFDAPTVAGLAGRIEMIRRGEARRESAPIEPTESDQPVPLSFSQEALWFLDQLAPGQPTFNVAAALRIKGPLEIAAFERESQ